MTTAAFKKEGLTGGTSADLDSIDGANLADNDFAIVMVESTNTIYHYLMVESSGAAENSPLVIAPDTNAGNKRWILQGSSVITGDLDGQGNYAVDLQNFPDMLSKGPGYWFDGVDDYIDITSTVAELVNTSNYTGSILWVGSINDFTSDNDRFWYFGDTNVNERIGLYSPATDNKIAGICVIAGTAQWAFSSDGTFSADNNCIIVLVHNGTEPLLYVNGKLEQITFSTATDKTAWFSDTTGIDNGYIGAGSYASGGILSYMNCHVYDFRLFNLALTAAEVKAFSNGAAIPYKYLGASQINGLTGDNTNFAGGTIGDWTVVTNGNGTVVYDGTNPSAEKVAKVTVGATPGTTTGGTIDTTDLTTVMTPYKTYNLSAKVYLPTGHSFTEVKCSFSNIVGDVVSTENTANLTVVDQWQYINTITVLAADITGELIVQGFSTTVGDLFYFDDISLTQIGCTLDLNQSGVGHNQWAGILGGSMFGATVSGALPTNLPVNHIQKYINLTVTGNGSFTLPLGYKINSIIAKETAGNALTGGLDVGLTTNGVEIVSGMAIGASATVVCTLIESGTIGGTLTTADDTIYFSDGDDDSAWGGAVLELTVTMERIY